jgi:hypothetical protein
LREGAATRFHIARLSQRDIAAIMGLQRDNVAWIMRRYVGRGAAAKAIICQLDTERRT